MLALKYCSNNFVLKVHWSPETREKAPSERAWMWQPSSLWLTSHAIFSLTQGCNDHPSVPELSCITSRRKSSISIDLFNGPLKNFILQMWKFWSQPKLPATQKNTSLRTMCRNSLRALQTFESISSGFLSALDYWSKVSCERAMSMRWQLCPSQRKCKKTWKLWKPSPGKTWMDWKRFFFSHWCTFSGRH